MSCHRVLNRGQSMKKQQRIQQIHSFVLRDVQTHSKDITKVTAAEFGISRQAASRHVRDLVKKGLLSARGKTRSRSYELATISEKAVQLAITPELEEDRVWRENFSPLVAALPPNISGICHYGFTEMFNNVIDHSEGTKVRTRMVMTAVTVEIWVIDNGIGIFEKIKRKLGLEDHRHAILELAKGKLTTDPERHTGEGVFFTSRMFDEFNILSGDLAFLHWQPDNDWLIEDTESEVGTVVKMLISTNSSRSTKEVFDKYVTAGDEFGFTKTIVPVSLLRYGTENLVSRSQAKRLLGRFERFKEIWLDFQGVPLIGQAFADEIFRVFQSTHPEIKLRWVDANEEVEKMIRRVTRESQ